MQSSAPAGMAEVEAMGVCEAIDGEEEREAISRQRSLEPAWERRPFADRRAGARVACL